MLLYFYLFILFFISIFGIFFLRKNLFLYLIFFEILVLVLIMFLAIQSIFSDDLSGQIFAIVLICVAGAESAIGLALLVLFNRLRGSVSLQVLNSLKG
jgi:NADH:ubiquinone oxidoreductase subunit K